MPRMAVFNKNEKLRPRVRFRRAHELKALVDRQHRHELLLPCSTELRRGQMLRPPPPVKQVPKVTLNSVLETFEDEQAA